MKKPLIVRDMFHGDMQFDFPIENVIDHPLFQRLKFIVQNGACYQVFPGMTHTRFQHSLGVCHIADQWFEHLTTDDAVIGILGRMSKEPNVHKAGGPELCLNETFAVYKSLFNDEGLRKKWKFLVSVAALCHDLGHGPFSHLLEETSFIPSSSFAEDVREKFGPKMTTLLGAFLDKEYPPSSHKRVDHEDITLVYLSVIFHDLERIDRDLFSTDSLHVACSLISKEFKKFYFEKKKDEPVQNRIFIFSSLTSGFIDADRLDYVVRDARMAGVDVGGVEPQRLIRTLVPFLFRANGKIESGFVSRFKFHHLIDGFFFDLYQVYTTVIYHPKALQMHASLAMIIKEYKEYTLGLGKKKNFIHWHCNSNDLLFIEEMRQEGFDGLTSTSKTIDKILNRDEAYSASGDLKSLYGLPDDFKIPASLTEKGYRPMPTRKREMMKDSANIWLLTEIDNEFWYDSWAKCSVVSQRLTGHGFRPNILWNNEALVKDLAEMVKLRKGPKKRVPGG